MSSGLQGALRVLGIEVSPGGAVDFWEKEPTIRDSARKASVGASQYAMANGRQKVALAAVDTAGGLFAWQNPEAVPILVTRVHADITTPASGTCLADIGVAADATTLSDNLMDGVDFGTAAGVFDNLENGGTNGKDKQRVDAKGGTNDYVTGSVVAAGASAGIVGNVYIEYIKL